MNIGEFRREGFIEPLEEPVPRKVEEPKEEPRKVEREEPVPVAP